MGVARIAISLDPELLRELDRITRRGGYANRSQAVRDLVRGALIAQRWRASASQVLATITILYDHRVRGLTRRLLERQHEHYHRIKSSTHVHLSPKACLEVLVAQGRAAEIQAIIRELRGLKGVLHAEAVAAAADLP